MTAVEVEPRTAEAPTVDDLSHFCCCVDHDRIFCGSEPAGGYVGVLYDCDCVVCADVHDTVGAGTCPFTGKVCPP